MPKSGTIVDHYLRAQYARRRIEDIGASRRLEQVLTEAANAAEHVFNVDCGDGERGDREPALLTRERFG